ncbi:MAG: YceI family protein [Bacteroidetes bacterium]|nr:MAG: YceI family protein [Bacteroidota bacterium]
MKKIFLLIVVLSISGITSAQGKYFTRDGHIDFFSSTSVEDIKANNNKVTCILDAETGNIEFAVLMKAFEFKKALMEEHFNENYVESEKYPKSKFKGNIQNIDDIDFSKDGSYEVDVVGQLMIHGETNDVSAKGTINITEGNVKVFSEFQIVLEDYKIEIPGVVEDKIAKALLITIDATMKPFNR